MDLNGVDLVHKMDNTRQTKTTWDPVTSTIFNIKIITFLNEKP